MKLYVGNIAHAMTEQELHDLFSTVGEVKSANIIKDKITGQSRGFGFVEMIDEESADAAIAQLDNKEVQTRKIKVSKAHPPRAREGGMGGGDRFSRFSRPRMPRR